MYKRLYFIGFGAYILSFILSILYCQERTIFTDIAYNLFFIIKRDYFAIQSFRYVAIFTQVFPLLASRAGLSLNAITYIYSSGFIFYYFGCYFICGTVLKQYRFALAVLLFNTLFVSHTFFWIQSELPQGIALMIVLSALMSYRKMSEMNAIVLACIFLGLMVVLFSHPLLVFPVTYILLFFLIRAEVVIEHKMIYATGIFFYVLIQIRKMVFSVYYDLMAMGKSGNILKRFPHYFNIDSNKHFLHDCITMYYWIPVLSIAIILLYGRGKEWKKLVLFTCFIVGYLLLINVSYPDKQENFYMENLYLPLAVFIAFPFVFDVLPVLANKKAAIPVLALIIVSFCTRIYAIHTPYTARLNWEKRLMDEYRNKKIIISTAKTPTDTLINAWGTPYEFWILSTVETGKTASLIVYDSVQTMDWAAAYKNRFITTWGVIPYDSLPKRYFHFEDTVSNYTIIK